MSPAIIPAKGRSGRFSGKNLALLWGRSLLEITVEKVQESGRFDRILVSPDDPRILEAAERLGIVAAAPA